MRSSISDYIKKYIVKNNGQYTNECLKHAHKDEFEGLWNGNANLSKQDLLHLKAESFLFQMQ